MTNTNQNYNKIINLHIIYSKSYINYKQFWLQIKILNLILFVILNLLFFFVDSNIFGKWS